MSNTWSTPVIEHREAVVAHLFDKGGGYGSGEPR